MNYSVKPKEYKFRKVKEQVEETLETYSYCMKVDNFDVNLGWQEFDKSVSFTVNDRSITLIINPNREIEELEKTLMQAVFHLEFRQNSVYENIEFGWQEIIGFAYANIREMNIIGGSNELNLKELEERWPELKSGIKNEGEGFDEELYLNTGQLGKAFGKHFTDQGLEPEDLLDLKRSDIIKAGDQIFG